MADHHPSSQVNSNQQSPYDNALPMHSGGELLGHHSVNAARNTFYVSDNQRQKANLFKDLNQAAGNNKMLVGGQQVARGGQVGGSNHYFAGASGGNSGSR